MSKDDSTGKIQWDRLIKKLSPYTVQKGLRYLKHYGLKEFWIRLHERFEPEEVPYGPWYEAYRPDEETLEKQRKRKFPDGPLISIVVPAYLTPERFLRQMLDSLLAQTYENWELCLANGSPEDPDMQTVLRSYAEMDRRIRYQDLKENLGIAENTNAAFAMAEGDFIALLDHDDLLAPNALYEIAAALEEHPEADVIYTDEDKVTTDLSEHFQPHLKPDFNLDLLRSNNYICHFLVVRRSVVQTVGGFRREFDGAQDYDFIFRCVEQAREVVHVPEILYHWRTHKSSTADNPASKMYAFDAGKRAIEAHLKRQGVEGTVSHTKDLGFYQVEYPVQGTPLVSVLIPNKDHTDDLEKCLHSIYAKTTYENFEVIVIENNSTDPATFAYYKDAEKRYEGLKVVTWPEKGFNFSAINNFGRKAAQGEYLLLLNNDVEVRNGDWLTELLRQCAHPGGAAICGAMLYYPDETLQHAGVVTGLGGYAGHSHKYKKAGGSGYLFRAATVQDFSAVTGACLLVRTSVWDEVKGLDEKFAVAFNDVDFCLRVRDKGYRIVWTPYAQLTHYESKSRGGDEKDPVKARRFAAEQQRLYEVHGKANILHDPYYNPNLTMDREDFSESDDLRGLKEGRITVQWRE